MPPYHAQKIEKTWQAYWEQHATFRAQDLVPDRPKLYVLDMFPYPSGAGLHVGHPEGYTATDIVCRYKRMRGFNVLHPMGWDAFGLPAEQYAIKEGIQPAITTRANIENFRRQIKSLGFSYDWSREVDTTDPAYYKWTQWIFLQLFDTWYDPDHAWIDPQGNARTGKGRPIAELPIPAGTPDPDAYRDGKRLAYRAEVPVNWCPELGTVLANEEVIDGKSERGGHPVVRMPLRQWMLRITAYADRLVDDLEPLDWSRAIKDMQRNWVGRSEGAEVVFRVGDTANPPEAATTAEPVASESEAAVRARADQFGVEFVDLRGRDLRPALDQMPESIARKFLVLPLALKGDALVVAMHDPTDFDTIDRLRFELGRVIEVVLAPKSAIVEAIDRHYGPTAAADVAAIRVFTTRPDTLFGATYMVLAPEHPLVDQLTTDRHRAEVVAYREAATRKSDLDRTELAKSKTGVFTGAFAINPVSGVPIPVWIADYVLMGYGTGAIMAVPGHDERDFAFARQFDLPIVRVVAKSPADADAPLASAEPEPGVAVRSRNDEITLDGLATAEAKAAITAWLESKGLGRKTVNTKLRDWLFSRQRYWGEPFPILLDENDRARAVPESELPVLLPELADFKPSGRPEPPLGKATEWVRYSDAARRETNTMPQWAGSCWYYLRYLDPKNAERPWDPALEKYWMPVDLYVGGAEHAVLHLLYSRFWHKVLFDRGLVSTPEPFQKLVNQGMILGEVEYTGYRDADGDWVGASQVEESEGAHVVKGSRPAQLVMPAKLEPEQVEKQGDGFVLAADPAIRVDARAHKMSKARGNVINPDVVVNEYGADSLRLYEMFMGPLEAVKPWNMKGVEGVYRFLGRAWRMIVDERAETVTLDPKVRDVPPTPEQAKLVARTVAAVTDDYERLSFNTAISRLMEFTNAFTAAEVRPQSAMATFTLLLAPMAPHAAEELWRALGHAESLAYAPWPAFDPALLVDEEVEVPVQINGKLRARVRVPAGADAAALEAAARADEKFAAMLEGKTVRKVIAVPGKLINFVVG